MALLNDNERWRLVQEDCIQHMPKMPAESIDFAVFSPPFPSLYAYTDSESDIGNSEDFRGDAKLHLSFFFHQLRRIVKPGRVVVVHVMQIPRLKRSGEVGLHDFRGLNIRLAERAGLVFEYDWAVRKNPQAQAIRTRSRELQFAGLETDRAKSRGCLPDYLLKFRAPGENAVLVNSEGQVSRNDWIQWAEGCWSDINNTDTLNTAAAKGEGDTKHIAPLQLPVIKRLVRLYTNPGEIVFSPFTGIGSEGYVALMERRRFYGCSCEACENCEPVPLVPVEGRGPERVPDDCGAATEPWKPDSYYDGWHDAWGQAERMYWRDGFIEGLSVAAVVVIAALVVVAKWRGWL